MRFYWVVLVCLLFVAESSNSGESDTEQQEADGRLEALEKSLEESDEMFKELGNTFNEAQRWAELETTISRNRVNACMAAFGHESFCGCLNDNLHWLLSFESYVDIITSSDAQPKPRPTTDEERAVNTVFRAREQCIGTILK